MLLNPLALNWFPKLRLSELRRLFQIGVIGEVPVWYFLSVAPFGAKPWKRVCIPNDRMADS